MGPAGKPSLQECILEGKVGLEKAKEFEKMSNGGG